MLLFLVFFGAGIVWVNEKYDLKCFSLLQFLFV